MAHNQEYRDLSRAYARIRNARELIDGTEVPEDLKALRQRVLDIAVDLEQVVLSRLEDMEK